MHRNKSHRLNVAAACVAMFAAGALLAVVSCGAVLAWWAKLELAATAGQLVEGSEAMARETLRTLDAARQSPHAACSPDDIAMLRDLAFRARLVKDVGRVDDGQLRCTGFMGRLDTPLAMPAPTLITEQGVRTYPDMAVPMSRDVKATVVQAGDVMAVMSPDAYVGVVDAPMKYSVSIVNRAAGSTVRSWGDMPALPDKVVPQSGSERLGDGYVRTQCSTEAPFCAATTLTRADIFGPHRQAFWLVGTLGGLAGLLVCLYGLSRWRREHSLENRLRHAIRKSHLTVVYQPVVDIETGAVAGAEALVRWSNEQGMPISADVFVQLAEEKGFIGEITRFVLRHVVAELGTLLRTHPELRININVAAADIADPDFFDELERRVAHARVHPRQIGIELTERSTAERGVAIAAVARLRASGHRVSIDDFGTGYSSLSYLNELDVDVIKIDQAFTRTVCTGAVTASIVPQIVAMARTLNLGVVVEGIETREQLEYFRAMHASLLGQGRFFAHPMGASEFSAWVAAHRRA